MNHDPAAQSLLPDMSTPPMSYSSYNSKSSIPVIVVDSDADSVHTVAYVRSDGSGLCRDGSPHQWSWWIKERIAFAGSRKL
ncbi:hypothetical protein BC938DRAFT_472552 [Jimgerdemannia flammicorona]|uniref:Uncharacterized protein n=1 Tax=Jimgerdemannia flammicorona TaxID=994334 RepID=A0A433QTZ6_9FUNG|nr:hypothetical protein BC938DRAFT_472552 [Jimgerdemannia flammicorona]